MSGIRNTSESTAIGDIDTGKDVVLSATKAVEDNISTNAHYTTETAEAYVQPKDPITGENVSVPRDTEANCRLVKGDVPADSMRSD